MTETLIVVCNHDFTMCCRERVGPASDEFLSSDVYSTEDLSILLLVASVVHKTTNQTVLKVEPSHHMRDNYSSLVE